jgi:hypothetical protein
MLPAAREVDRMKAMKLRLLLVGALVALIGVARVAIGGLGDPYAAPPLLLVWAVMVVLGVLWK